jgi:uncharacterized cysteine cluster protein YcgN (CxxCxxCC family)
VSLSRVAWLLRRIKERWEAICRRCGGCCYEKEIAGGKVLIDYRSPCRHLDASTGLCIVYDRRFRECRECRKMTIFHALFVSYLPNSCGYVQLFRPWRKRAARADPRSASGPCPVAA